MRRRLENTYLVSYQYTTKLIPLCEPNNPIKFGNVTFVTSSTGNQLVLDAEHMIHSVVGDIPVVIISISKLD